MDQTKDEKIKTSLDALEVLKANNLGFVADALYHNIRLGSRMFTKGGRLNRSALQRELQITSKQVSELLEHVRYVLKEYAPEEMIVPPPQVLIGSLQEMQNQQKRNPRGKQKKKPR